MTLQMIYAPNGWIAGGGEALGLADRRARSHLDDCKRFIEDRGRETGAWRGAIVH